MTAKTNTTLKTARSKKENIKTRTPRNNKIILMERPASNVNSKNSSNRILMKKCRPLWFALLWFESAYFVSRKAAKILIPDVSWWDLLTFHENLKFFKFWHFSQIPKIQLKTYFQIRTVNKIKTVYSFWNFKQTPFNKITSNSIHFEKSLKQDPTYNTTQKCPNFSRRLARNFLQQRVLRTMWKELRNPKYWSPMFSGEIY